MTLALTLLLGVVAGMTGYQCARLDLGEGRLVAGTTKWLLRTVYGGASLAALGIIVAVWTT